MRRGRKRINRQAAEIKNRVCQKSDEQAIDTKRELAKAAGVSHDTVAKVPLLERKREIVAGQAKERMLATLKQGDESPAKVNLPERAVETRDSIAAEIGVSNIRSRTPPANP